MRCRGSAWRLAAGARSLHASTFSLYRYSYATVQSSSPASSVSPFRPLHPAAPYVRFSHVLRCTSVGYVQTCTGTSTDLYRYIHMSVGVCLLDSETVGGMPRCTTRSYAYLMCIVRTGTGTDPLGIVYWYRPDRKCVPVPVPT
jgi:hypothetical protein